MQGDLLFELIRLLELPEVQLLQELYIWLLQHNDDGFVPLRVEGLHVVAPELKVQKVWHVRNCTVCIADLEMLVGHTCALVSQSITLTVFPIR